MIPRAIHTLSEAKAPFTFVEHGPLEMSSCFSGLGTPEVAGESIVEALRIRFKDKISLVSNVAFDINKLSRSVLIQDRSIGAVGGDLLDLWPRHIRERLTDGFDAFDDLVSFATSNAASLNDRFWCYRSEAYQRVRLGHIHIAGSPCTDFSSMGKRRGFGGSNNYSVC